MVQRDIGTLRTRLSWEDDGNKAGMEGLKRDLKGLRSEMNLARSGGKDYTNSLKGMREQSNILTRQFKTQETQVKELRKRHKELTDAGKEDTVAAKNLESQINNTTAQMNRTEGQLKRLNEEVRRMESPWTKIGETMTKTGDTMQKVGRGMTSFGKEYSMKVTAPIVAGGVAAFKASMDFESAFAGVEKTFSGTTDQLADLRVGIREMAKEIPASTTEISAVAEAAGQLGVEAENVEEFTRTMIDLGEATNMTAEVAATEFARFANIVGMSQDDFDRLGSSTVALGNTMATTESEISSLSLRLAAQGSQVGMSESQILALAASMSSLGIEAESGGTSMTTVLKKIDSAVGESGKELEGFAKAAGVSSKEFAKQWESDPIKALDTFIKGLATSGEEGENLSSILADLGIKGIRESDTILRLAGASDILSGAVNTSSKAWEENTALTEEAETRYATTESQLKILWNRVKDMAITTGDALVPALMGALDAAEPLIQKIESGAQAFADMTEEEQQTILKTIALVAAIGPAAVAVGGMTTAIGGVLKVSGGLATSLGAAGGTGLIGKIGLMGAGSTLPVGLAIGGLAALAGGAYYLYQNMNELHDISTDVAEGLLDQAVSLEELVNEYDKLKGKTELSNEEFSRYIDLQGEMKKATDPEVILAISQEMEFLREKSGMSNTELKKMVDLNGDIIEQSPTVEKTFTDKGNAVIESTDAVREYINSLRDMAVIELETERVKALENEAALRKENKEIAEEIRVVEEDIQRLLDMREMPLGVVRERIEEILGLQYDTNISAEEQNELQKELTTLLDIENGKIVESLEHMQEQRNTLLEKQELNNDEIAKLDRVNKQLETAYLQNAGITDEKAEQAVHEGKSINVLDEQLENLREQKRELQRTTPISEQNTEEYRKAVGEIEKQIGKLQTAKRNVEGLTSEAENYTNELAKDVDKTVNTKMSPSIDDLNKRLTSPLTRFINLRTNGIGMPLPGYAAGTDGNIGGLAMVGAVI